MMSLKYHAYTRWKRKRWAAWQKMFVSPIARSYFSPMSGARALKVCYHLVRQSRFLLLNWFEGLKVTHLTQYSPTKAARPNLMHRAHIFSLFLSKTERGEQEKAPQKEECETLLKGKIGPSISLFLPLPSLCVAHKGSRQAARNQFHGATRWKSKRKRQKKTEKLYKDFTGPKAKITNMYWLVFHLSI